MLAYLLFYALDENYIAQRVLQVTVFVGVLPLVYDILSSLYKRQFGVDLIALLSIGGSLLLGENLAGAIILLMLSGGEYLEDYALRRSKKELTKLIEGAPTIAHIRKGEELIDVSLDKIHVGDVLVVKPGEIIPVDGLVVEGTGMVVEASITGESTPVTKFENAQVFSGSINQDAILTIEATHTSANSKYQQIVELVKRSVAEKAPFVRLADRYAVIFTLITIIIAGLAWIISDDPVRALTVLVVATPCPLILATPIAFAAGVSKAAEGGVVFRTTAAIEILANPRTIVFDKTGTLTLGTPVITKVQLTNKHKEDEVIKIAASLEQFSQHILAKALVQEAKDRSLPLTMPNNFQEKFGYGVYGELDGKAYLIGKPALLAEMDIELSREHKISYEECKQSGLMTAFLVEDRQVVAIINFEDKPRPNIKRLFGNLSSLGLRVLMLTGDRYEVAAKLAANYDISDFNAGVLPEEKLLEVESLQKQGNGPVVMVGDGVNDAPALAKADVGIALGTFGSNASTDTSDVVITVPEISKVFAAISLSQRVLLIAKQSIFVGIGLSTILMVFGAFGLFIPVVGALLQELIDVVVILNALRVKTNKATD